MDTTDTVLAGLAIAAMALGGLCVCVPVVRYYWCTGRVMKPSRSDNDLENMIAHALPTGGSRESLA